MTTVLKHYDTHLGPLYSWMVGDFEAALARSTAELEALGLPNAIAGTAVDLGAGIGLHTLPLARLGYSVTAIDTCQGLLDELRLRADGLPVNPVAADLRAFPQHLRRPADVILCMGDTLTHLPDRASVEALLAAVGESLADGGLFATTFRDYASLQLEGERRFIPVRGDENRILTCFLEYSQTHVMVHDLLQQRENGQWQQRVSSYPKLRLHPDQVAATLTELGLSVRRGAGPAGMVRIAATKP